MRDKIEKILALQGCDGYDAIGEILSLLAPELEKAEKPQVVKVEANGVLIDALKAVYRKHAMGDDSLGWDELSDIVKDALCEAIGDERFNEFLKEVPDGD